MRIFVAGATGVLGKRIVAECTQRGHDVLGLTRDETGDDIVTEHGGMPVRGDILDRSTLTDPVSRADIVVHAATKIPVDTNPSEQAWKRNDRVRLDGTKNLLKAAESDAIDRFILQSIAWLARQPTGEPFDENADPHPDRSTRSALESERTLREAAINNDYDPVIIRGGYFYGPDTAHTRLFGQRLLAGDLPIIGRGLFGRRDATLSFIHVDDIGRAFADAIEGSPTGIFHVVDEQPTAFAEFVNEFANRLNAPTPSRLPAWIARFFIGDNLVRLLTRSMPTSNHRFSQAFDWTPEYPSIHDGLDHVVQTWDENGLIQPTSGGYEWTGD